MKQTETTISLGSKGKIWIVKSSREILASLEPGTAANQGYHYNDVLLALCALLVMPVYLYGMRVVWLMLAAVLTALAVEFLCNRLAGRNKIPKGDRSCLVTALITVALMPATAPVWVVIFSVAFGLAIAKHPFGGTGKNIFNPAAAGVAFCAICWPEILLRYPVPFTTQGGADAVVQIGTSPASILSVGGTPNIDYFDVMLGDFAGPLGTTCMLVLGADLLYLLLRRRLSPLIVAAPLFVVGLTAVLFPRTTTGLLNSVVYEFSSGALIFGIVFLANDPATMPETRAGRLFYGLVLGVIIVIMRRFGAVELEFVYAILGANIFADSCDRYAGRLRQQWRKLRAAGRRMPKAVLRKASDPEKAAMAAEGEGVHA